MEVLDEDRLSVAIDGPALCPLIATIKQSVG